MKCAACQYDSSASEVILFKRGPRKGQVKEKRTRRKFWVLTFRAETEDISIGSFVAPLTVEVKLDDYHNLYGCPECGTVRMERW
jgi:hypothetical protein